MALAASYPLLDSIYNLQKDEEIYNKFDEDQPRSSANEEPKLLVKNESPQKEKEISVDPMSLIRETSTSAKDTDLFELPLPLVLPAKPKFLSKILFNSTNLSPLFSSATLNKKWRDEVDRDSSLESPQKEAQLRKNQSCNGGRASSALVTDDIDPWMLEKSHMTKCDEKYFESLSRIESGNSNENVSKHNPKSSEIFAMRKDKEDEGGFKCGALCLFLPGFSKGKIVRATRKEIVGTNLGQEKTNMMSRTVSLEKFECGSWASSTLVNDNEDGDSMNLYFDLPIELIRSGLNDAHSPITTTFLFTKDHQKGVLKSNSTPRKSHDQSALRHVRFSTSSPTSYPTSPTSCITPRLLQARKDFNAFLEAHSA